MEPKAAEVVPKVIVKESAVTGAAASTVEVITKAREKFDQGAWPEALKIIKEPPIEQNRINAKLGQFGTERDAATGAKKLSPEEQTRYDSAEAAAGLAKKFVEVGYDKMSATEQTVLRNKILEQTNLRTFLQQELQGLNDDQKKEFAERYLKDPRYSSEVRRVFQELLDPDRKFTDITGFKDKKESADLDLGDAK